MSNARTNALCDFFKSTYAADPEFGVRAPGRVNLIGEHTDYNDGFCLPMAIERDVRVVGTVRDDMQVRVVSMEERGDAEFALGPAIAHAEPSVAWTDYVRGCAQVLIDAGHALKGCDLALTGDVPLGSGLSSSAALEVAVIHAFCAAASIELDAVTIARLAQSAENTYVGTNCGILDQLSSSCGMQGQAMLMDCRSLGLEPAPLPEGVAIVIADTGKRRGLVDSAYNERRSQCEAGASAIGVSHLRDASLHQLLEAEQSGKIDALTRARCEHVVAENGRTQAARACLQAGDAEALGSLMDASHMDLRDKFAVTCPELDVMTGLARNLPGCYGSRMTGAGFGGCTVSLVAADQTTAFVEALTTAYQGRFDLPVAVYVTGAAAGAGALAL